MTVVNRKTEPVIRRAKLVITFTPSLTVGSLSVRSLSHDEQDLWYATDDKAEHEATIGLREVTKSHKSRKFKKFLVVVNM